MAKFMLALVALMAVTAVASGRSLTQMMNGMSNMNGMMSGMSPMGSMNMGNMAMSPMMMGKTVAATAMANPNLSILVEALNKANLTSTLNDPNLVATVFAPTNDAFGALLKKMNMTKDQLLMSYILKPTLMYHVVPGVAAMSGNLTNMEMLPTMLKGSSLMVHLMNGVMIDGAASNATVTTANMMADKAIVHVVDTVLVPATKTLDTYKPMAMST